MKTELDNLKELVKKIQAKGIIEGIYKVWSFFCLLAENKSNQKAVRLTNSFHPISPPENCKAITEAINDLNKIIVIYETALNKFLENVTDKEQDIHQENSNE